MSNPSSQFYDANCPFVSLVCFNFLLLSDPRISLPATLRKGFMSLNTEELQMFSVCDCSSSTAVSRVYRSCLEHGPSCEDLVRTICLYRCRIIGPFVLLSIYPYYCFTGAEMLHHFFFYTELKPSGASQQNMLQCAH